MTNPLTLTLQQIDRQHAGIVGGKGANLAALSNINGITVPEGFCVTTTAFEEIVHKDQRFNALLDELMLRKDDSHAAISKISQKIRTVIERIPVSPTLRETVARQLQLHDAHSAWAVRSSATAEDLPTASFAGQQDSYLNIVGQDAILQHISRCWASLFTGRAVVYRQQHGFDHRKVLIAVVIQKMIFADASGVMFTADPVNGNRKTISINACFGLGEALVSGRVNADLYRVKDNVVAEKIIGSKDIIMRSAFDGSGITTENIGTQHQQALHDDEIITLATIGSIVEKHFSSPQDIEWCLADREFYIVQSRPVTNLFPIPEADDDGRHVYISVGHQQMMTDPIKPLGLSIWQLTSHARMHQAAGRLFVDISKQLYLPHTRNVLLNAMAQHDPLIKDACDTIIERGDVVAIAHEDPMEPDATFSQHSLHTQPSLESNPAVVADLIAQSEKSLATVKDDILTKSGAELLDFIHDDISGYFRKNLFNPQSMGVIMSGINAATWVNEQMNAWLGKKNVADILARSAPGNVTSEMGLALLDVADAIRDHPQIIAFLQTTQADNFLNELPRFEGGIDVSAAIRKYLDKYGMRCTGEIDITRTRWSEKPITLIPLLLGHIKNFERGESKRKFLQGQLDAKRMEEEIIARLGSLPDSEQKIADTKTRISLIRNYSGYREYPKYSLVSRYFVYKQAILKEVERLTHRNNAIHQDDIYYLTLQELREAISSGELDHQLIAERKEQYSGYEKLTPPRVITSDGEVINGKYKREDIPAAALVGLAVSAGVIEGRARVLMSMNQADISEGDILVTKFTDPSWTPLFVSVKGLVTEVGGLMTHGAVIAREYGLPAVVGVEHATKVIQDGQRIRVNGSDGYVEIV